MMRRSRNPARSGFVSMRSSSAEIHSAVSSGSISGSWSLNASNARTALGTSRPLSFFYKTRPSQRHCGAYPGRSRALPGRSFQHRPVERPGQRKFLYGRGMAEERDGARIIVTRNGPYQVGGAVPLSKQIIEPNAEGESWEWREGKRFEVGNGYRLCRCGGSANKPFCD